jgi:hypothetical protein
MSKQQIDEFAKLIKEVYDENESRKDFLIYILKLVREKKEPEKFIEPCLEMLEARLKKPDFIKLMNEKYNFEGTGITPLCYVTSSVWHGYVHNNSENKNEVVELLKRYGADFTQSPSAFDKEIRRVIKKGTCDEGGTCADFINKHIDTIKGIGYYQSAYFKSVIEEKNLEAFSTLLEKDVELPKYLFQRIIEKAKTEKNPLIVKQFCEKISEKFGQGSEEFKSLMHEIDSISKTTPLMNVLELIQDEDEFDIRKKIFNVLKEYGVDIIKSLQPLEHRSFQGKKAEYEKIIQRFEKEIEEEMQRPSPSPQAKSALSHSREDICEFCVIS